MKLLAIFLAVLIAVQPQPGFAQPDPPSPPSEHMIDRFVEGLPRELWPALVPPEPDRDRPEALGALNPGKEAQIAAILRASDACTDAATALESELVVRAAARHLGMAKLRRLMDLFAGPDFKLLDALTDRLDHSATPAAADLAERDRLGAAYPIGEFATELLRREALAAADPDYVAAVRKCRSERSAALARAGIRTPRGQARPSGTIEPPLAPRAPPGLVMRRPDPPAASEAQVERFLASLPEEVKTGTEAMKLDAESVKRLIALNPGKEAQIETILSAFGKCSQPAVVAGMERVNRLVARSPLLGGDKLERLTAFFDGGGWALLTAVGNRIDKSATPAATDLAERERLMAAYPLAEFALSLQVAALNAVHQGAFADAKKCENERNAALAKAGIENPLKPLFGS